MISSNPDTMPDHESILPVLSRCGIVAWAGVAVISFHLSYYVPALSFLIAAYVFALVQLARIGTARAAFGIGFLTGFLVFAPQLFFFFNIFGPLACFLWLIGAFWTGLFVLLARGALQRLGPRMAVLVIPMLWMGLEFFRSEVYSMRFSWLIPGYVFAGHGQPMLVCYVGVYGVGFLLALVSVLLWLLKPRTRLAVGCALLLLLGTVANWTGLRQTDPDHYTDGPVVSGVQLEFPSESILLAELDKLIERYPQTEIVVLSEYTFNRPVPQSVCDWCRQRERYLIVGGIDPLPDAEGEFRNTAFVLDPTAEVVFKQAKSVPIQFFHDGRPARQQRVWNSPWGKIGLCICYDMSYTRVTDELVRQGAQLLIVPTMDVTSWGRREHELHSMVGPARAAEYGVPILRVCSSGISQFISQQGRVTASLPYPGQGESLSAVVAMVDRRHVPKDRTVAWCAMAITAVFVVLLSANWIRERAN